MFITFKFLYAQWSDHLSYLLYGLRLRYILQYKLNECYNITSLHCLLKIIFPTTSLVLISCDFICNVLLFPSNFLLVLITHEVIDQMICYINIVERRSLNYVTKIWVIRGSDNVTKFSEGAI